MKMIMVLVVMVMMIMIGVMVVWYRLIRSRAMCSHPWPPTNRGPQLACDDDGRNAALAALRVLGNREELIERAREQDKDAQVFLRILNYQVREGKETFFDFFSIRRGTLGLMHADPPGAYPLPYELCIPR
jgi:hypothetical protein